MNDLSYSCVGCNPQGDFTHHNVENAEENTQVQISIHNLPNGITNEGVRNLFLSIGTPVSLHFNAAKNLAYVTLESLNQVELAIRDLHKKPPYNLDVALCKKKNKLSKILHECKYDTKDWSSDSGSPIDFVAEKITFEGSTRNDTSTAQIPCHVQTLLKNVNYGPSYRVHRRNCDYKVLNGFSVSMGRGYFYSGPKERHVGGLQTCKYTSEEDDELMGNDYFCENCRAPTARMCSNCSMTFCSNFCLKGSVIHKLSDCFVGAEEASETTLDDSNYIFQGRKVLLQPQCSVVITTFSTLDTVFVRRVDNTWDEQFVTLMNDVAFAGLKETSLEEGVSVGETYAVKYKEDETYYRGQVLSVNDSKSSVYFLDFGNVQETDVSDIKPLDEDLKRAPRFAVKIKLNDIPEGTSAEAVSYLNKLTAESVTLILKFENSVSGGKTLVEKDSGEVVNGKLKKLISPSWRIDPSVLSKLGDVFFLESIPTQSLAVGERHNLTVTYVNEDEFKEGGCFWCVNEEEDNYQYLNEEVKAKMIEYCEYLKGDFYLPRETELCLVDDEGNWRRCVCLNSVGTTCWVFFIDDGKTSFVETKNIRKMVADFLECPQQAIRCVLSDEFTREEGVRGKVLEYIRRMIGKSLDSVLVKYYKNGDYHLDISEIETLLTADNAYLSTVFNDLRQQ